MNPLHEILYEHIDSLDAKKDGRIIKAIRQLIEIESVMRVKLNASRKAQRELYNQIEDLNYRLTEALE